MFLLAILALGAVSAPQALAAPMAKTRIRILGAGLYLDTRPDVDGLQSTMTAVKEIPSAVSTIVGAANVSSRPAFAEGTLVKAEITGPDFATSGPKTLSAKPNERIDLPLFRIAGVYRLYNVRMVNPAGGVVLARDQGAEPIIITVIDQILVTQVTTKALTAAEIQARGIVVDEDNYTVMNFAVALTLGSKPVKIDLPVFVPKTYDKEVETPTAASIPGLQAQLDAVNIPNLSLTGFQLQAPPDPEIADIDLPAISGVIVIPGNIAYLNQFLSVFLQATNMAPAGSGLVLRNAKAKISLPAGDDKISGTGDDPLRLAETSSGTADTLPLSNSAGSDTMNPQATHQAEFLVEGVKEGSHGLSFDLSGDLYVPQLSRTVAMTGKAAGLVQVKNPTFNIVLSHPKTVRRGEEYGVTATVTNTSNSPANYFQLALNTRAMTGCEPLPGETGVRSVSSIAAGESASFTFRMKALVTGEVGGTVFLADGGVNGSFMLTTGVGDKGIPLSPDTLVLPGTVDALPKTPADLAAAATRLLGQAYSVATAPEGSLPEGVERISRGCVSEKAVFLAQAGLHCQFGETPEKAAFDLLANYLGVDYARLSALYPNDPAAASQAAHNLSAFDALRRTTGAGADFTAAASAILAEGLKTKPLSGLILEWAESAASGPPRLSFGVAGASSMVRLTDADGRSTGRVSADSVGASDLPFSALLELTPADRAIYSAVPDSGSYTFEFATESAGDVSVSLVVPSGSGMVSVVYPAVALNAGAYAKMTWSASGGNTYIFEVDTDHDGSFDTSLAPLSVTPVTDPAPVVLGVRQWGKGTVPHADSFETGDALGSLIGVLFSEEVSEIEAASLSSYGVAGIGVRAVAFQPDRRMAFITLRAPVGPFVPRSLGVTEVRDMAGQAMADALVPITPDTELGPGATYSGQVVSADGRPVSFATVEYFAPVMVYDPTIQAEEAREVVVSTLTADLNGRVALDFILQNTASDFNGQASTQFSLRASDPTDGRECQVKNRVFYNGQKMQYNLILRGTGTIKGRLYDAAGLPVSGGDPGTPESLAVYAIHTATQKTVTGWVDANGFYAFPRSFTKADGAKVEVPAIEVGNVLLRVVRVSDQATALATVNLARDGAVVTRDLVLFTGVASLAGRVLESDGSTGAAGVAVSVKGRMISTDYLTTGGYETGLVGVAVTDSSGGFSFTGLPAGSLTVTALRKATAETAKTSVYIEPGQSKTTSIVLPGYGGQVSGCVTDALGNPVPNAVVSSGYSIAKADATGCFTFTNMPLGPYTITARKLSGMAVGSASGTLFTKNDAPQVLLAIEPTGSIRGTVREADEATPVSSQKVQLWIKKGGEYLIGTTVTDSSGHYEFKDYPTGDYSVRAVAENYGDGGMAFTSLTAAGDERTVNVNFRGMGEISGRVLEDAGNGSTTPVISDVVITRKVWRIVAGNSNANNYYLDFVLKLKDNPDFSEAVDEALESVDFSLEQPVFFMLTSEPVLVKSDILDENGAVTGRFSYTGPVTGGPFKVAAFGPFLSPTEVTGEIPRSTTVEGRRVSVGDIVLSPAVGRVTGRVFLPDGVTPVGEGVAVTIKSLDSSGAVPGVNIGQAALPEQTARTDSDGFYQFDTVLKGRCDLVADTGAPYTPAARIADILTDSFAALNVKLSGRSSWVVPQGIATPLVADIRLSGVAGLKIRVLDSNGQVLDGPVSVSVTGFNPQTYYRPASEFLEIFPVPEGPFSVSANFDGAMGAVSGTVPKIYGNAWPISIDVKLGSVSSGGTTSQVSHFGTVAGSISRADGSAVTSPCQVTVSSSGAKIIGTSDNTGHYSIENAPGGFVTVSVVEPMTGRTGSATGTISQADQTIFVNVRLLGAGEVTGTVMDGTGAVVAHPVDIVLTPTGDPTRKILGRTDGAGLYSIPGVPLGAYTVLADDSFSGLTGLASGSLYNDGQVSTTDVFLEPAGSITGKIYGPGVYFDTAGNPVDINGAPLSNPAVVANATVVLTKGASAEVAITDSSGNFTSSANLTLGTWKITATLSGDGCEKSVSLTFGGERAGVVMAMTGSGTVSGVVTGGANAPVTLVSQSPYAAGPLQMLTDESGAFSFSGVNVGKFTVTVQSGLLSGAASGEISYHDDKVNFSGQSAVTLEVSGTVTGRVFLDDGFTPAAGTRVQAANGVTLVAFADADGSYTFTKIPRHTYNIGFYHAASGGVGRVAANLASDFLALAPVTLDSVAPTVVFTTPLSDASDVDANLVIAANFSEPVNPDTVSASTFLVRENGVPVSGTVSVFIADPTQVIFQPTAPFGDMSRITVTIKGDRLGFEGQVIEAGIGDIHGLGMKADHAFSFTTGDTRPPALVSISPANGALGVDTASVLRLTFSEPVTQASLSGALTLIDETGGGTVSGTLAPVTGFGGRVWAFAPDALLTDRTYRADIAPSVADLVGNAMAAPVASRFSTTDTLVPEISGLSTMEGASLVSGTTVPVTALASDGTGVARVEFFVGDALFATDSGAPFVFGLPLLPEYGQEVKVSAVAFDAAGNRSERRYLTVTIHENQAPVVSISSPANGGETGLGQVVNVTVQVSDDVGAASVTLTAAGGSLFAKTTAVPSGASSVSFAFTVPEDWDRAIPVTLHASAVDGMGLSSDAGEVALSVADHLAPVVNIVSPANGGRFEPDTPISLTVTASDSSGIDNFDLSVTGATADHTQWFNTPGGSPVSHTFILTIPIGAAPTSPVNVTVTVTDGANNVGTKTLVLWPADHVIPSAATLTCLGGNNVEPGTVRWVRVVSDDNVGIAKIKVTVGGFFSQVRDVAPSSHSQQDFYFTVPAGTPLGTSIPVTALVWDSSENALAAAPISLTTADLTAPSVSIASPANNSEVIPGTDVTISVNSADSFGVSRLAFSATGAATASVEENYGPPVLQAQKTFTLHVPENAPSYGTISITVIAYDPTGNTRNAAISLKVKDVVGPSVVGITPANGSVNVSENIAIGVNFSEAVAASSIGYSTLILANADGIQITGTYSLPGSTVAVFTPNTALAFGRQYTLTVTTGIIDLAGNHMAAQRVSSFTVWDPEVLMDQDNDADGFTPREGDYDDANPNIHPGKIEICGDGIDQNCDGLDLICGGTCNIAPSEHVVTPSIPFGYNGNPEYGWSVAVSDRYAVVGAPSSNSDPIMGSVTKSGVAYVYERTGASWLKKAILQKQTPAFDDKFGYSVAVYGDCILVGVYGDDTGYANSGSVMVFERDSSGAWPQTAVLRPSDAKASANFGVSVALFRNRALIGASGDSSYAGAAYIFEKTTTGWSQKAKLVSNVSQGYFGHHVALHEGRALIGAHNETPPGGPSRAGAAYISELADEVWSQPYRLTASDKQASAYFGWSVSLSGEKAAIGADNTTVAGRPGYGAAYVFKKSSQTPWTEVQKVVDLTIDIGDHYGWSVSIYGDYVAAGSCWDRSGLTYVGSVSLWADDGTGNYALREKIMSTYPATRRMGYSVALGPGYLFTGALDSNSAHMFRYYCESLGQ